ncbi:monovalent cation/H(+) antiporter subunit G [Legionella nagasakiensis]|uniref:monovalent cation/H(+) antiporter subunit G n=1 Tax=Legionella nagasakiensis TaxID=535290 RepID=UPI0010544B9A|nr:monovalent cation/H(+) antiporter subunit G [Legionella nagasakiensis]
MWSNLFLLVGAMFILIAALGIMRMPDLFLRMHAAAKAGTLGVSLMLVAEALYFSTWLVTLKVSMAIVFMFLSAPVGFHLIGRASYRQNVAFDQATKKEERTEIYK